MLYLTRGLTFNLDEWIVVTERRGPGAPSLLAPHNEHLSVLIIGTFVALLKIGGLDAFVLFMVPLVALQLALGVLLFVIAKARVGVGVAVAVAAGRAAVGPRVRELPDPRPGRPDGVDRRRRRGVPTSSTARPVQRNDRLLCGADDRRAVLVGARDPDPRRRRRRAAADAGRPPRGCGSSPCRSRLYFVWYVAFGTNRAGVQDLDAQRAVGVDGDEPRDRRDDRRAPDRAGPRLPDRRCSSCSPTARFACRRASRVRLAAIATVLLTFYGLTAISRLGIAPPSSSRYLTVGLVFLLLMLVEAARGWKIRPWVPVRRAAARARLDLQGLEDRVQGRALAVLAALRARARVARRGRAARARARRPAVRGRAARGAVPRGRALVRRASTTCAATRATARSELLRASADARAFADDTLVRAGGLALRPAAAESRRPASPRGPARPVACRRRGVRVEARPSAELTLQRAALRRASGSMVGVLPVAPGHAVELRPLHDASPLPYVVRAPGAARSAGCSARPPPHRGASPRRRVLAR